ncbi:calcium-binding protein [Microvirga sp. 0TCS3.31]
MTTYRITTKRKALKGSATDDFFFGSKFKDIFDGRAGDDYIFGADGNDSLTGGAGNDDIYGSLGSDKAFGGLGRDYVDGGLGNDKLYGDAGRDTLIGDEGNDSLYGGEGRDFLYGDEGNDRLDGGDDDDYLAGHDGSDSLYGDEGQDDLSGGKGDDRLYGGDDDDYLDGYEGNDRLDGGKGDDSLYGGAGNDYLSGGAGDDFIDGTDPIPSTDPTIPVASSRDRLLGGDGNDTAKVDGEDYALGGKGVDTLILQANGSSSDYTVYSLNFAKVTGKSAASIGYLGIKAGQFEKVDVDVYEMDVGSVVTGTKGNDVIYGSGKSGVINGGSGDDYLSADGYNADNPANGIVVNGGAGDDKLSGSGDVTLIGGKGDDEFALDDYTECTIADFSNKDFFTIGADSFTRYDPILNKNLPLPFDMINLLVVGADPKATSTLAQFLYDTDDGKLYYDRDGVGTEYDLDLVTTLANKAALKASDFVFVI